MKTKLGIAAMVLVVLTVLGLIIHAQSVRIKSLNDNLSIAVNNIKAYEFENQQLKDKAMEFQYTVDQINHSNDSLIRKINQIRKDLKIKDKQILELQYFASENQKVDSIFVTDTVFREGVALDTLIGDRWSRLAIHAEYPNILNVDYSFSNETTVIAHGSRVTVDPPKKC